MRDRGARVDAAGAERHTARVHLEERERSLREVDGGGSALSFRFGRSQRAVQAGGVAAVIGGDRIAPEAAAVGRTLDRVRAEPLGDGESSRIRVYVVDLR